MRNKKPINEQNEFDINLSLINKQLNTTAEKTPFYYYTFNYGLATIYIRKSKKKYQIAGRIPEKIIKNWKAYQKNIIQKRKLFDIYYQDEDLFKTRRKFLDITQEIITYFEINTELEFILTEFQT